jgi:hypothetical protein
MRGPDDRSGDLDQSRTGDLDHPVLGLAPANREVALVGTQDHSYRLHFFDTWSLTRR